MARVNRYLVDANYDACSACHVAKIDTWRCLIGPRGTGYHLSHTDWSVPILWLTGIIGAQGRDEYIEDDVEQYFNYMGILAVEVTSKIPLRDRYRPMRQSCWGGGRCFTECVIWRDHTTLNVENIVFAKSRVGCL
jgi:hypothetical protein